LARAAEEFGASQKPKAVRAPANHAPAEIEASTRRLSRRVIIVCIAAPSSLLAIVLRLELVDDLTKEWLAGGARQNIADCLGGLHKISNRANLVSKHQALSRSIMLLPMSSAGFVRFVPRFRLRYLRAYAF
jgi:hypothetical protein